MDQQPVYRFDDFVVDPGTWKLTCDGEEVHLEPVVLKLLIYLIAHRDRLVTRQELMDTVWGDTVIGESALTKAVARLRKALQDDSGHPCYLETVHSQGYRFIAIVEEIERPEGLDSPSGKTGARTARMGWFAGVAAIVIVVLLAVFWVRAPEDDAPVMPGIRSLAVLPLSNLTGDAEQDYYVDGLQDILITELSQIAGLRVTSRQSTKRYRNSDLLTGDIAAELGVDALVEGSLLREGSTLELTVQLIHGQSDEHIWAARYARETADVFNLIADVADAIGAEISADPLASRTEGLTHNRIGPVDPRAIDAYALGTMYLDRFTRNGIRSAIEQLETAVAIEPGFALAWGQLGAAYAMQGMMGYGSPRESKDKLRAAALRAIEADSQVSIGHSGLGWARWWTGEFDRACESFDEALRLNPSAPYAIHGDADCLLFEGRIDASVARLRELVTVSPFSAMHNWPLASHLYVARRFDEAIAVATGMQTRIPQFSMRWFLAKIYWQQGLFDKALQEERLELERRGDAALLVALETGLAVDGPTGAMRAMAEALVDRERESYVDPFDIGETFARAGAVDEALRWLDKAVEHGSYEINYVAFWPHLDALRDDPRYEALLERVYGQQVPPGKL